MSNTLQAVEISGNVASNSMSLFSLVMQADFVVKLVLLILLAASIACWAIFLNKLSIIKILNKKLHKFEQHFWSGYSLNQLYDKLKNRPADNVLAAIFLAAMHEIRNSSSLHQNNFRSLKVSDRARIDQAMYSAGSREMNNLSKNIAVLATVNTSATYIGLFGTVWGIMNSFQAIAASKNTTLAVVAPGIAEALFATAIGLLAAIPAGIFYNIIITKIDALNNVVENFTGELSNLLSREDEE